MPRRLSLDDGTVARSAAFCLHQLIFPTHADSPAQRAFTDSAGRKPLLLFFSLFACTDPLSTTALLAREQSAECGTFQGKECNHLLRQHPAGSRSHCLFVGLFVLFLFLQRNTIPHHRHQKSTVSLPDIDVCIIFVLFKEPSPWSLLLTHRGGVG